MSHSTTRRLRLWFPAAALAAALAVTFYFYATAHFARHFFALIALFLLATSLGIWFAFVIGRVPLKHRLVRFAAVALVFVVVIFGFGKIFRYEGSSDGAALPKLALRWTPETAVAPLALPEPSASAAAVPPADAQPIPPHQDAPQYLGPHRNGTHPTIKLDPDWQSNPPRELWRQPVGLGWGGFAVSGRFAVTQEQRDDAELVVAYHLLTGEPLWLHNNPGTRFSEAMGGDGPRATPTIHAGSGKVYTLGATGILDCLDLQTGNLHWSRNTLSEHIGAPLEWGKSTSPLVLDQPPLVIVTGSRNTPTVLAYHRDTGEPAWTAGDDDASYSSPVFAPNLAGRPQVVSTNATTVTGHDPATGDTLWSWSWPSKHARCGQPLLLPGGRVLVSAGYGLGSHLLQVSAVDDAKCSVAHLWHSTRMRAKFSSLLLLDNHAIGLDESVLAAIDLETGDRAWKFKRYGYGQNLLVGGDTLLVQAERGHVTLVPATAPDEPGEELARLDALSAKTWNIPTLAAPYLLLRNDREAVCYELPLR